MDVNDEKLQAEATGYDHVPSSAFNKRRTALTESGSVFSRSRVGGKEIRIPASAASQTVASESYSDTGTIARNDTSRTYSSGYPSSAAQKPNKRATISTNRVFSPYDLSFFEDPVTTRELSKTEQKRINDKRYAEQPEAVFVSRTVMVIPGCKFSIRISPDLSV